MSFLCIIFLGYLSLGTEPEVRKLPEFVSAYIELAGLAYEALEGTYSEEAKENIDYMGLTNPRWIAADFNGDSREDWAGFLVNQDNRVELVVVYSFREAYAHETLNQLGLDSDYIGYGLFVEPPGAIEGFPIDDKLPTPTATLSYPSIHLVWFEKASALFYWQDGSFEAMLTGD